MTNTILLKMQEKEKKSEKKPAAPAPKGMRRNKTTVNLGRNKLSKSERPEKSEKSEKPEKDKLRKSMAIKTTAPEVKKPKLLSMSMRTEPNEKKETTEKKGEKKGKDKSSNPLAKSMIKSKTVARLSPKKNKRDLTPTKKNKKEEKKKDEFKTEIKKDKDEKTEEKKEKKEEKKKEEKKEEKKKDEGKKDEKKKEEKKKEEGKKDDKKKEDKKKEDKKKDDKPKKEEKKKDDKSKKKNKKDDKKKDKKDVKKETKKDKKEEKKVEKKPGKKEEKKEDKKEDKKEEKKEEPKPEEKKEEVKPEEKKEEVKPEEKKEEPKPEEKKEEIKPEDNKEIPKPEEKKEEIKENTEVKKEEPPKEEPPKEEPKKEEPPKNEDQEKKEEPKVTGKPKTILMMKFISILDKYSPYLTDEDIYTIGKVSKKFYKPCLEKLKEINSQKLSKEEKELESINAEGENSKLINEFTLGKVATKALESLNDKSHTEYFQKEEVPGEAILLTYRILYQLINKEKDILKEKDNNKFWKLFRENLLKNSEKGIGNYIQNEFKNLDFSEENIHRLNCLCEGQEERLGPINIGKKDNTAKFICFLIKEALEYIKIVIGTSKNKKVNNSEVYKKYLEYIINKRKEDQKKLDNLISKA